MGLGKGKRNFDGKFRFPEYQLLRHNKYRLRAEDGTDTAAEVEASFRLSVDSQRPETLQIAHRRTMAGSTEWVPTLWRDTFDEMLSDDNELDYDDQWTLNFNYSQDDIVTKEQKRRGWRIYCHKAHGDFECESCSKIWHSARIVVLFRYRLQNSRGTVIMRPFGQTCRSCENGQFEQPGFPQDEVELALNRLFSKIRKNCYGEESDDDNGDSSRKQKLTKPHESTLCEACMAGICSQDKDQLC